MAIKYDKILGQIREADETGGGGGGDGDGDVRDIQVNHSGEPTQQDVADWQPGTAGMVETTSGFFWCYIGKRDHQLHSCEMG